MLINQLGNLDLKEIIISKEELYPFPRIGDRKGWEVVTPETKSEWISTADKYLEFTWPTMTADRYLLYNRKGDNITFLKTFFTRRSVLGIFVLAECMEGKGRFLDQIINGIYCICEETTWMTPFDLSNKKEILPAPDDYIVDLSCSETGALLAWTHYLLKEQFDTISSRICERIEKEVQERLIIPYLEHDDYWWMGFIETPYVNNWNPWCNRNMLMCFLLLGKDLEERNSGIKKIMKSLDVYLTKYAPDGCCNEGPMYWGAAGGGLHVCLELLKLASSGKIDIYSEPIVQEIGRYIYKVHIHDDYFVDFADGDARVEISPSVYFYGMDINDTNMINLGRNAPSNKPNTSSWFGIYEHMRDILKEVERKKIEAKVPYVGDSWMGYTQVMTTREKNGSQSGFFLAAKGGNNFEAHNHNDVGNFIVYVDGKPLLIDIGTEEYTSKTFSANRYELWYLQSKYHNCPTINNFLQKDGKNFRAKDVECSISDFCTEVRMNIEEAYPEKAGIDSWTRICRLNKGDRACVEVIDKYYLKQALGQISFNLLTPCEPQIVAPGSIRLEYEAGKSVNLSYDKDNLFFKSEVIYLQESRLKKNWGEVIYRITLTEKVPLLTGLRSINITRN